MRFKKIVSSVILATSLSTSFMLSGLTNPGSAYADSVKAQNENVTGTAGIILKIDLNSEDKKLLGKDFLKKVEKEDGWKRTKTGYEKFYPARDGSLTVNGKEVDLATNGTFAITEKAKLLDIQFKANGQEIHTKIENTKDKPQNIDLVKTIDFKDFIQAMDGEMVNSESGDISIQSEVGQRHYPGDRVHCNRFNGRYTDHVYYNHWDPRAWKNFISSDCDWAFFSYDCENDYTSDTKCRGLQSAYNYRNCSWALGHSNKYHYWDN
ncbi:hypothetical protein [Neobacillus thermocopriae]|jgi:hypothetical protein|uniref:Uncharacterized protein n=1 Tax=Neobacillus thermocopriae TaxID=1215031 RepID=A0A6B3TM98_9BACI|nr:hypothetical protein [Neobacillus thermocopriae]MED3622651.1 hypothetical protein [Neobacillus thermocopriae]MED3714259.1 hypothetical protein [Neobacillus thermocopriae]NEX77798.1 hypothetical protein [Neobacillus thermocopriae]